jgi:hypothetical protein
MYIGEEESRFNSIWSIAKEYKSMDFDVTDPTKGRSTPFTPQM